MSLITIDGRLYIDQDEFSYLLAISALENQGNEMYWRLQARAKELYGHAAEFGQWTDRFLLYALRALGSHEAAYGTKVQYETGALPLEYGEEMLGHKIFGIDTDKVDLPNLSPIGWASVEGKIALELARRLEAELAGDAEAKQRAPWQAKIQMDDPQ